MNLKDSKKEFETTLALVKKAHESSTEVYVENVAVALGQLFWVYEYLSKAMDDSIEREDLLSVIEGLKREAMNKESKISNLEELLARASSTTREQQRLVRLGVFEKV